MQRRDGGGEGGRRFMGEEEKTVTANIQRTPHPPSGSSNTVNAQLGQTFPSHGGKQKLGEETRAKGEIWKP